MSFANIFSMSVTYIPIVLILPFTERKFLILMMSNLIVISFMDCLFVVVS